MEQLRSTMLAEVDTLGPKSRFGLFSQPPSIALGDDSQYQSKKSKR